MNYKIKKEQKTFFNRIWLLLIIVLIIYAFFFQYAVRAFSSLMVILCGNIILCGGFQVFVNQQGRIKKSLMGPMLVFVFLSSFFTIFVTAQGEYGTVLCIRMMEYVLTAYSIYLLLQNQPKYIEIVCGCMCLTITLLGIVSLVQGVAITSAGARGIEGLNTNSMSSFFIIMVFCSFYLFQKKKSKMTNLILVLMNAVVVVAQILAASRRGFIVIVFLLASSIIFALVPYKSADNSKKKIILYILLIGIVSIALVYFKNYLLNNTVLGARLLGSYDGGDVARTKYQTFALEQFKEHPILGIGLEGIAYHMGAYSHSMYYELFSCTGTILALVFLVGFLRFGIKYLRINIMYRKLQTNKGIIYITTVCLFFWLSLLISGYSVVMIYDFYFYFSIALLAVIYKNVKLNESEIYL